MASTHSIPRYYAPPSTEYDHPLKTVLIGNAESGVKSLISRFVDDTYSDRYHPSSAGSFCKVKMCEILDPKTSETISIKSNVWGYQKSTRFTNPTDDDFHYVCRTADIIMFVFDLTDKNSFEALPDWFNQIDRCITEYEYVPIIIGNKCDLTTRIAVKPEELEKFLETHPNCLYFETSAKTGKNVTAAFKHAMHEAVKKRSGTTLASARSAPKAEAKTEEKTTSKNQKTQIREIIATLKPTDPIKSFLTHLEECNQLILDAGTLIDPEWGTLRESAFTKLFEMIRINSIKPTAPMLPVMELEILNRVKSWAIFSKPRFGGSTATKIQRIYTRIAEIEQSRRPIGIRHDTLASSSASPAGREAKDRPLGPPSSHTVATAARAESESGSEPVLDPASGTITTERSSRIGLLLGEPGATPSAQAIAIDREAAERNAAFFASSFSSSPAGREAKDRPLGPSSSHTVATAARAGSEPGSEPVVDPASGTITTGRSSRIGLLGESGVEPSAQAIVIHAGVARRNANLF